MKPTAVLLNVSRGAIWDEKAVYKALKEGRIAAAGADVFETEPPTRTCLCSAFPITSAAPTPRP